MLLLLTVLYYSASAVITNFHNLGGLPIGNSLSHRSSKSRCWQGLFPVRAGREGLSLSACKWQSSYSHGIHSVCVSVSKFPVLTGYQSYSSRAHPTKLILTYVETLSLLYLYIMSHFEVLGVRTLTYEFWEDTIQPLTHD